MASLRQRMMKELAKKPKPVLEIGGESLPGAPNFPNIPGRGTVRIGRNQEIMDWAQEYANSPKSQKRGILYDPVNEYAPLDEDFSKAVANEYGLMKHTPREKEVKRAYGALGSETMDQFEGLLSKGFKPYWIEGTDPYSNSPYEALIDLYQNKRLGIFPTRDGFGSGNEFDVSGNPLLAESGMKLEGKPVLLNDAFRFIHDAAGHAKQGAGFRAMGEENAYLAHAPMFSNDARRALASETRGQNSWLNSGPFGEANRKAGILDTVFADQKTGIMPNWAIEGNRPGDRRENFERAMRQRDFGLRGAVDEKGRVALTHYSPRDLERIDPQKQLTGLVRKGTSEYNRLSGKHSEAPARSYYGIQGKGVANPYRKETQVGDKKHQATLPGELLYDATNDPEKLFKGGSASKGEAAVKAANYSGYFFDHPDLGKVAVVYDALQAKRLKESGFANPIMLAGAAGALGAGMTLYSQESDAGIIEKGGKRMLEAYHGTPHSFDKFSMDKIGTGEGNQVYGHGLYFADAKDTAKSYREGLSQKGGGSYRYTADGQTIERGHPDYHAADMASMIQEYPEDFKSPDDIADWLDLEVGARGLLDPDAAAARAQELLANPIQKERIMGALYKAHIDVDPDSLLDWDKPFSQQSKAVQDSVRGALADVPPDGIIKNLDGSIEPDASGRLLYQHLSDIGKSQSQASMSLRNAGVPGLRYLDQNSRAAGEGTNNYVMFDDKPISIVERGAARPGVLAGTAAATGLGMGGVSMMGSPQDAMAAMQGEGLKTGLDLAASTLADTGQFLYGALSSPINAAFGGDASDAFTEATAKPWYETKTQGARLLDDMSNDAMGAVAGYKPPLSDQTIGEQTSGVLRSAGNAYSGTVKPWMVENLGQQGAEVAEGLGIGTAGVLATLGLPGKGKVASKVAEEMAYPSYSSTRVARSRLTPAQSEAMDTPKKARERRDYAAGVLDSPVNYEKAPENTWLLDHRLADDAMEGHPGVLQSPIQRTAPGPRQSIGAATRPWQNTENVDLVRRQIERGRNASGEQWYPSTYPIKAFMEETPGAANFEDFAWANAFTSPQSSVPVNLPTATAVMTLQKRGLPLTTKNLELLHEELVDKYGKAGVNKFFAPQERLDQYQRYLDSGTPPSGKDSAEKITSYGQALRGNLSNIPLDTHEIAGTSFGSTLYPHWISQGSVGTGLYGPYEEAYRGVIQGMGLPPSSGQASRWIGGGELTGLRTAPGTFLDLTEQLARNSAMVKGGDQTRAGALEQLRLGLSGEEPLLPVYSRKQLLSIDPRNYR